MKVVGEKLRRVGLVGVEHMMPAELCLPAGSVRFTAAGIPCCCRTSNKTRSSGSGTRCGLSISSRTQPSRRTSRFITVRAGGLRGSSARTLIPEALSRRSGRAPCRIMPPVPATATTGTGPPPWPTARSSLSIPRPAWCTTLQESAIPIITSICLR